MSGRTNLRSGNGARSRSNFGPSNLAKEGRVAASEMFEGGTVIPQREHGLVSAAQAGCRIAFDELFHLYSRRIYRTIFAITKNSEDAEDAMQESFLRAFLAISRFEGRANFYSWLTRIAINTSLMILRKRRTRPACSLTNISGEDGEIVAIDFKDSAPSPEETYYRRQRQSKLLSAIRGLPPNLRQIVEVYLLGECSIKELSKKLDISEAAVKSRLYRARARLKVSPHLRLEPSAQIVSRS